MERACGSRSDYDRQDLPAKKISNGLLWFQLTGKYQVLSQLKQVLAIFRRGLYTLSGYGGHCNNMAEFDTKLLDVFIPF